MVRTPKGISRGHRKTAGLTHRRFSFQSSFHFMEICCFFLTPSITNPFSKASSSYQIHRNRIPLHHCRLEDDSNSAACLVKVVESNSSGMLELLNPLTTRKISTVPQLADHDDNNKKKKIINMLDFRLVELIKGYSFDFKKLRRGVKIRKAILCDDNGGIFVLFDSGKLWYWGFGDENWTRLGNEGTCYDDVIMVYKGRYYVIDSLGIISWIDKSMNLVQYAPPLCGFGQLKNLVVSNGDFYVVDSYLEEGGTGVMGDEKLDIKVYKLDEEWGTWVDVKSIGDRIFVLEKQLCFSVSVEDFPRCQGDCIYFAGPSLEDRNLAAQPDDGWLGCFDSIMEALGQLIVFLVTRSCSRHP